MRASGIIASVVLALAAVAACLVIGSPGEPGRGGALPVVSARDGDGRPAAFAPPARPSAPVDALVPELPEAAEPVSSPEAAPPEDGTMAALVRRLREVEERRPADFHHGAAEELRPFLDAPGPVGGAADEPRIPIERRDALRAIVDGWELSPRVRGAALALLGAWIGTEEVLSRMPAEGEAWRSAVVGLGCPQSVAGEATPVRIALMEYAELAPGNLALLPFVLSRIPDPTLEAVLVAQASRLVDAESGWHDRVTAVLALGPAIDTRPGVFDLMSRLLADDSPWGRQVHHPVCYVMARARGDAARERLLQFLESREPGDDLGNLVRYWMSDQPALPTDLEVLAAPLLDPRSTEHDRLMSAGSLLKRAELLSPEQVPLFVELIARALERETDDTVRMTLVATLASKPEGRGAVVVLERVLLSDAPRSQRIWAARGLGAVAPELAGAARAALGSARSVVTDTGILEAIDEALAALP